MAFCLLRVCIWSLGVNEQPHSLVGITFHRAGVSEPDSKLDWSFQMALGQGLYKDGTFHDMGVGCIWTHLDTRPAELVTRKEVQEQMALSS